jgi:hypothetical protein
VIRRHSSEADGLDGCVECQTIKPASCCTYFPLGHIRAVIIFFHSAVSTASHPLVGLHDVPALRASDQAVAGGGPSVLVDAYSGGGCLHAAPPIES